MKIGLIDVDYSGFCNLALMKISAYHKARGDKVEWYNPFNHYDKLYMAKVFSFSEDYHQWIVNADSIEKGGTGYDVCKVLPREIDRLQPDYSIYPSIDNRTAYGFLTRGCPNKCKWCIVPRKEGSITAYMDIDEIAINGRNNIILMDNNILASDYGLQQLEKIVRLGLRVDFNQGLDARLVTDDIAKLLAKVKWIKRIRFGCDTPQQIEECERATALIDKHGYKGEYFFYCILLDDFNEAFTRVNHWRNRGGRFLTHCQPYRDLNNPRQVIPQWQKDLASWADKKWIFRSCEFKDFVPRKGFKCEEYFNR
ncbi:MAG: radical SAM protein [Porphyromonadaceae bacterium]|nr:radical SAM protein [Porphyromonadaceae bacterium]